MNGLIEQRSENRGMSSHPCVLMQGAPELGLPPWVAFHRPLRVVSAASPAEVPAAMAAVEEALARGHWAAGFIGYEAAPAFDPAMEVREAGPLPLAWFGIYTTWEEAHEPRTDGRGDGWTGAASVDAASYAVVIDRIKERIARGETYQVNYTMRLRGAAPASARAAFARLHRAQRGGHSAFIETESFALCSASPELFFRLDGDRIVCRPMKGTAARGRWLEEDGAQAEALRASAKDRAENVMIVDMVRNDLGRIAEPGSVRTASLFDLQRLPTAWQMTSTVEAATTAPFGEIVRALFPSASVTGAPKIQTMKIIRALEDAPRGAYTGAIGFVGPGRKAQFNVAIRTLQVDRRAVTAEYGTGGGIVWDSDAAREYEECRTKALVLEESEPFRLVTTMRWSPDEGYLLLERHIERLRRAARYFDFRFNVDDLRRALRERAAAFPAPHGDGPGAGRFPPTMDRRVRVLVDEDGRVDIEAGPAPAPADAPRRVALAARPVDTSSPFVFHKTTRRRFYEDARAARPDCDDAILWNERGEVTESTICNVAIRRDGAWITPPISCGLLAGVLREDLLARGELREGLITRKDLAGAREVALFNAVRGWMAAEVVSGKEGDRC